MQLFLKTALLPSGWARDVLIGCDASGRIASVAIDAVAPPDAERLRGIALAGMPNLHSHAPQRVIAGLSERSGSGIDSFWSWREAMYRAVGRIGPEQLKAVATQLYIEMLRAGYTTVAEFHYLHHDLDGRPYADRAEMGHRLIAAARTAGIRLVLLPVLYAAGDFFGAPPAPGQRWLEYGQRLFTRRRAVLCGGKERSVGCNLLAAVLAGGAQACGGGGGRGGGPPPSCCLTTITRYWRPATMMRCWIPGCSPAMPQWCAMWWWAAGSSSATAIIATRMQ
jgi:hypothetical protein